MNFFEQMTPHIEQKNEGIKKIKATNASLAARSKAGSKS
jgi:hypothetical protein